MAFSEFFPIRSTRTVSASVGLWVLLAASWHAQAFQLTVQHLYPQLTDVQFEENFDAITENGSESDLPFFHSFAYRNLDVDPYLTDHSKAGGLTFRVEMNSSFDFFAVPGNALRLIDHLDRFHPFFAVRVLQTNIVGFTSDRVTFDSDSITLHFSGLSVQEGQFVNLDITSLSSSFSVFTPRAEFTLGLRENDDSYWVRGWLTLADTSNGIDPLTEPVTIKVGSFSHTIPAGSFVQEGSAYKYVGAVGPSKLDVSFWPQAKAGAYWFKSCVKNGILADTTLQPEVELTVGDDSGKATLDVSSAKFGTGKSGQKWVFPPQIE